MLATSARSAADSAFHHRLAGEQVTLHLEGCDRRTAASGELAGLVALGAVTGASWHPARTAFTSACRTTSRSPAGSSGLGEGGRGATFAATGLDSP